MIFPNMNLTGLYVYKRIIFYWHIFHSSGFHHICNIKCRLNCRYSPQNIFNAKNFNPHKKPISLLNVPICICTQGMQRTWWPEASTIIVTGPLLAQSKDDYLVDLDGDQWNIYFVSNPHIQPWSLTEKLDNTRLSMNPPSISNLRRTSFHQIVTLHMALDPCRILSSSSKG